MKTHVKANDQPGDERRLEWSALFDGECDPDAARRLVRQATQDAELREDWRLYVLLGDCLRGETRRASDMTAVVMERLRDEPAVLAPRALVARQPHPFVALAASLAGVALVGWLAWTDGTESVRGGERFAAVPPAPTLAAVSAAAPARNLPPALPTATLRAEIDEFLLAHHMQAAGVRIGDGTERVRTISHVVGAARP